ncbi:TIGR02757 family protein [bacterium]|nr:TIGR02757 family protein [bacterium]
MSKRKIEAKNHLFEELEELYTRFNRFELIKPDPLQYVWDYSAKEDQEVVGLLMSSLAYGNVKQILTSGQKLLKPLGKSPAHFIKEASEPEIYALTKNFKHRWHTGHDLSGLIIGIKNCQHQYGFLENIFLKELKNEHAHVLPALSGFVKTIVENAPAFRKNLLPFPNLKSACKRLMMYLRWMVRKDAVDPGPWNQVPASLLLMPLDTHSFRFCRFKKMTKLNQANMQSVLDITEAFKQINPADPVKYDFAISRLGIRRKLLN